MTQFSLAELFGVTIRESANDGSDFTNPSADYRRLFLGEDGILHLKDSSGTVTDIGASGAPSTADYLVGTANGSLSAEIVVGTTPGGELGGTWASPTVDKSHAGATHYFARRLMASPTNQTLDVNSTSYAEGAVLDFYLDADIFPFSHFAITGYMASSTAGQTITLQLTTQAALTNPISAGGDDLVINSTLELKTSGWIAVSDAISGFTAYTLAIKGSNSTVDLLIRHLDVHFKVA